ncbi:transcriptional regulator, TetR family [Natronincola peptidivorans]|uniref:Transcriptional regulator, TetR family n=1 Tax=Natronincola peptidivorans TaxID=426128 RepID=A0A1I0A113_9FIRM|nr:TetR/AcrR family transcriptional regulator [Natronincola peptidivorans]SES87776.1 transcriptional regulator, TetR family [Natronincola peptidivorans]
MARNTELNEKIKEERREQILAMSLKLFVTKGLAATKITDISTALGLSQGLIYHYFSSKEEVFIELIRSAYHNMTEAAVGLESLPLTPQEKIRIAIEKLLQGFDEGNDAAYYFMLIIQAQVFETVPDEAKEIIKGRYLLHDVITRIIDEGQKEGTFKMYDARELALVFWGIMNGFAIQKAIGGDNLKMPKPDVLMDLFLHETTLNNEKK